MLSLAIGLGGGRTAAAHVSGAQVDGHVVGDVRCAPGRRRCRGPRSASAKLRVRIFAERRDDSATHVRLSSSGYVDGLVADRDATGAPADATDAIVRPAGSVCRHRRAAAFDVRAGASRLVWGRLDEFQPTDVVNPIDLSRFLLEGRSEARLPVGLVRARLFLPRATTLEAVIVPCFRRGRFDQLDEPTSPFNLAADGPRPDCRDATACG